MINQAFDDLETMSADRVTRDFAERREKALKDETMFLNEARRLGRRDMQISIAEKLILKGLEISEIAELTGLNAEEIAKISQNRIQEAG